MGILMRSLDEIHNKKPTFFKVGCIFKSPFGGLGGLISIHLRLIRTFFWNV